MQWSEISNRVVDECRELLRGVDERAVARLEREIQRKRPIFFTAAGRSLILLRPFAMRMMQFGFESHVIGDTTTPAVRKNDLVIVVSATGKTPGVILRAKQARELGARVFAITSSGRSPLARVASSRLIIPPLPGGSMQLGACWFEQTMFLLLEAVSYRIAKANRITLKQLRSRHASLE